jgi:hypothetical protein
MVVVGPKVTLEEPGQNAIVAWNGREEIIVLSTNVKSSKSTLVLEVLPLPSNPEVKEGSFDSFKKLVELISKKGVVRQKPLGMGAKAKAKAGVEITFHQKIGAHDLTAVKVNDLNHFMDWVENFTKSKGFEGKVSPGFRGAVANYLSRDIKFFVFDFIEAGRDEKSVKPLIYRFKTDFLYYPLEITAYSDVGPSSSEVNVFLIAKGRIDESVIRRASLWPMAGFDYNIELSEKELEEVSPEIAELFSSAYAMYVYFDGELVNLNKDLIVHQQDVHVPTFFDKISQRISSLISPFLFMVALPLLFILTFTIGFVVGFLVKKFKK